MSWYCDFCQKDFASNYSLKRHCATFHEGESNTQARFEHVNSEVDDNSIDYESDVEEDAQPAISNVGITKYDVGKIARKRNRKGLQSTSVTIDCTSDDDEDIDDIAITPLWKVWFKKVATQLDITTPEEVDENYATFVKNLCEEAYSQRRMYLDMMNNDTVYGQLVKEMQRLRNHGYKTHGEAWKRAWSNRKCLIKLLIVKILDDLTKKEDNNEKVFTRIRWPIY